MTLQDWIQEKTASARMSVDRRGLDSLLLKYRDAAAQYREQKLPAGHAYYQRINRACQQAVNEFAKKWNLDAEELTMAYPFMNELETLAKGSQKGSGAVAIGLACLALVVLAGVVPGVIVKIYNWVIG